MTVDPDWLKDYGPHLQFILSQVSPFTAPGFISLPLALAFPALRTALKDKLALAAFWGIPFLWMFLVGWCSIFVAAMDADHDSPWWAEIPLYANFWGLPAIAGILIWRAKGARWISFGYALFNAAPWFFVCFIAAMAISGNWI